MSDKHEQLAFKPSQVAKMINVSQTAVYEMLDAGHLWFTRGPRRISLSTIEAWCDSREQVQLVVAKEQTSK